MRASRRPQQAWVWHAELSKQQSRNAGASVNLQHMYEPVRTSVLLGLQSYAPGRHDWNVSARVVSDAALLQASFDQQPARRLLERKLQPLRAGDLFVWLGQAAGHRLAQALSRLRRDLSQSPLAAPACF